jgi:hypothetical protein
MDKKISLEHTIRNVVSESIGVSGTDKFQGTPRAFLRPAPLITPKKEGEHPNGSVNLAQRGRAKIDTSNDRGTMRLEGKIGVEHAIRNIMERGGISDLIPPVVKPPKAPTAPPPVDPKIIPKPEPEVAPKPAEPKPDAPFVPKPQTPSVPKTDAPSVPKPQTPSVPKIQTPNLPKPQTPNVPKQEIPGKTKTQTPELPRTPKRFIFPLMNMDGTPISGPRDYVPAEIYIHHAAKRKTFGEDFNSDAEKIKQKSRKAQIIRKILDEKKKKDTETVNMNPKLKVQDIEEGSKAKAILGTAATLGGSAALGAGTNTMDKARSYNAPRASGEKTDILGLSNKDYGGTDLALDAASMVPFIGTPAAAYSTYRAASRGDWADAGLNALSMIPGLGTVLKGGKLTAKAGAAALKYGKPASAAATGLQLGDAGKQIHDYAKTIQDTSGQTYMKSLGDAGYNIGAEVSKDVKKAGQEISKKVKPYLGY